MASSPSDIMEDTKTLVALQGGQPQRRSSSRVKRIIGDVANDDSDEEVSLHGKKGSKQLMKDPAKKPAVRAKPKQASSKPGASKKKKSSTKTAPEEKDLELVPRSDYNHVVMKLELAQQSQATVKQQYGLTFSTTFGSLLSSSGECTLELRLQQRAVAKAMYSSDSGTYSDDENGSTVASASSPASRSITSINSHTTGATGATKSTNGTDESKCDHGSQGSVVAVAYGADEE